MVGYLEEPGVWHQSPEEDEDRALAWARRMKGKLLSREDSALTLLPFLKGFFSPSGAWVERMRQKGQTMSERHLANYEGQIRNYIEPLFGDADPRELSARYIDDTILAAKGRNGRVLATATKYKIIHAFDLVLADLADQRIIPNNPLAGLQAYSKKPTRPRAALPREILAALFPPTHGGAIQVWGRSMWASLMGVFYDTGMRPGEARRMTWRSIFLEDEAVVIRRAEKAGNSGAGTTKNGAVRAGRLSERTLQELAIWRMESRHSGDGDLVFTLDGKAPVTDAAIGEAFKRGLKAIGKEREGADWTPYWIRHSFVTYALATLDPREVALLAGHSEAIARGVYSHPDDRVVLQQSKNARKKLGES